MNQPAPAQPPVPPFSHIAVAPVLHFLDHLQAASSRREKLDLAHPQRILVHLHEGIGEARMVYASVLSRTTQNCIETFLSQAQHYAQHGMGMWQAVDQADRTGDVDALVAGFGSEETEFGAEVGNNLFGGWGAVVGAMIGGMVASQRVEEKIERAMQQYAQWFDGWLRYLGNQLEYQIDPSVVLDLQGRQGPAAPPRKPPPKWLLPLGLAAVAWTIIGVIWWRHQRGEEHAREQERVAAEAKKAAVDPKIERARSLVGTWRTNRGDELKAATYEGSNTVTFTLTRGASGSAYPDGELVFSVQVDGTGSLFPVELVVRPTLPTNVKLDADAQRRCKETWTKIGEQKLVAQIEGDRLVFDGVKINVPANGLEVSGGKVTGCKPLDPLKATRVPWMLTR